MKIENVVVISLEDYTEYQELKNKKKDVDFDSIKPGSVVTLKLNPTIDLTAGTYEMYNKDAPYHILLMNSDKQISEKGVYKAKSNVYTTAVSPTGNFIHIINFNASMIDKVIAY